MSDALTGSFAPLQRSLQVAAQVEKARSTRNLVSQASRERVERMAREDSNAAAERLKRDLAAFGAEAALVMQPAPDVVRTEMSAPAASPEPVRRELARAMAERGHAVPSQDLAPAVGSGAATIEGLQKRIDAVFDSLSDRMQQAIATGDPDLARELLLQADRMRRDVAGLEAPLGARGTALVQQTNALREQLHQAAVAGGVAPREEALEPGLR